jgi:hypothetical protein
LERAACTTGFRESTQFTSNLPRADCGGVATAKRNVVLYDLVTIGKDERPGAINCHVSARALR